jgi:hypothetical protein
LLILAIQKYMYHLAKKAKKEEDDLYEEEWAAEMAKQEEEEKIKQEASGMNSLLRARSTYGNNMIVEYGNEDDYLNSAIHHAFKMITDISAAMRSAKDDEFGGDDDTASSVTIEDVSTMLKSLGRSATLASKNTAMTIVCRYCSAEKKV